jgi:hypothetical protein
VAATLVAVAGHAGSTALASRAAVSRMDGLVTKSGAAPGCITRRWRLRIAEVASRVEGAPHDEFAIRVAS